MMIEGRNIDEAAKRVADMSYEEVQLNAKHDPDLFRHVALGYRAVKGATPRKAKIKGMVERFLRWRLPSDFHPDNGIKYEGYQGPPGFEPTGTNLLTYTQAEAMVRHMIEGMP